jgi:hypothetical protein
MRTGEGDEDGVRCSGHEESCTAVVSAQKSSTTINLPSLEIGQQCGPSMLVVLASGSMGMGAADAASRAREWEVSEIFPRDSRVGPGPVHSDQARTYLLNQPIVRCQARSAAALL